MSNRPFSVNFKRMKFNNPYPSPEECATKGLLLMAAGRQTQSEEYRKQDYEKNIDIGFYRDFGVELF